MTAWYLLECDYHCMTERELGEDEAAQVYICCRHGLPMTVTRLAESS